MISTGDIIIVNDLGYIYNDEKRQLLPVEVDMEDNLIFVDCPPVKFDGRKAYRLACKCEIVNLKHIKVGATNEPIGTAESNVADK